MKFKSIAFILFYCAALSTGQTPGTTPIDLSSYDVRGSQVPAGTNTTLLTFTVEGDSAGNNAFDVVTSDPGVVVSVILPSGTPEHAPL
jgi:hypothetical protein